MTKNEKCNNDISIAPICGESRSFCFLRKSKKDLIKLNIEEDKEDSQMLKQNVQDINSLLIKHNDHLKNSNDSQDDSFCMTVLYNSGSSNGEGKPNLHMKNLFKYIKLADRFLYEEKKLQKSLSTFHYSLQLVDEIFEFSKDSNDKSGIFDFSKFVLENEATILKIKLKILHSICYINEKLNLTSNLESHYNLILILNENDFYAYYKKWSFNKNNKDLLRKAINVCNVDSIKNFMLYEFNN
jgi:hypothetical protein